MISSRFDHETRPATVGVVGCGFCGTMVALHLARQAPNSLRILIFERSDRLARGTAYGASSPGHLLNVPAGRMSINSADALEFLKFAQQRFPATAEDFLPRSLYGEYLESALMDAELSSPSHVQLHKVVGTVCSIERTASVMVSSLMHSF